MASSPAPESSARRPSLAAVQDAVGAMSEPELPSEPYSDVPLRSPGRTRSQTSRPVSSRQVGVAVSEPDPRFARDSEPMYLSGGSRRAQRHRFREDWDDEYEPEPWDDSRPPRNTRPYWRDDYRRQRNNSYRSGPWSRPPPAILNQRSGMAINEDDDDYNRGYNEESRPMRESFDTPMRRRPADEEMGYTSDQPIRAPSRKAPTTQTTRTQDAGPAKRIDWNDLTQKEKSEVLRLPWTQWMNSNIKNHFVATLGETVGTTMFLFFAFAGTEVANIQSNSNEDTTTGGDTGFDVSVLLYISLIFGFSLMINVWIFFRISGGLMNPAVTVAMFLVKAISLTRAVCLFVAQMAGSMLASVMVRYIFPESFNVRTTLGSTTSLLQGVFIEALLTAELVFTIFMLAKEKHKATFIAPVGIGLALFVAEMAGVQFTGGSLNPARSFGPCAVTATFDSEHWIYWVGPLGGSLIAVVFYRFIKTLEYEMANPGADGDPDNDPTKNPEKRAEIRMSSE